MKQAIIRRAQFTGNLYKGCRKARYFLQWFAERGCTVRVQAVHRDTKSFVSFFLFLHIVVAGSPLFFSLQSFLLGTNAVPSFASGGVTGNSFICRSLARVGRVVGITFI